MSNYKSGSAMSKDSDESGRSSGDICITHQLIKSRVEIKRKQHNGIERKRKDKINEWIYRIGDLLPFREPKKESKNGILERAVNYIKELKGRNDKLLDGNVDQVIGEQLSRLNKRIKDLEEVNLCYYNLLKCAGISTNASPSDLWDTQSRPGKYSHKINPQHVNVKSFFKNNNNREEEKKVGDDKNKNENEVHQSETTSRDYNDECQLNKKHKRQRNKKKEKEKKLLSDDNSDDNQHSSDGMMTETSNNDKEIGKRKRSRIKSMSDNRLNINERKRSITGKKELLEIRPSLNSSSITMNNNLSPIISITSNNQHQAGGFQINPNSSINIMSSPQLQMQSSGQLIFGSIPYSQPQPQATAILLPNGQLLPIITQQQQQQPSLFYSPNQGLVLTNGQFQTQPTIITGASNNIAGNTIQMCTSSTSTTSSMMTTNESSTPSIKKSISNQKVTVKTTTIEKVPSSPKPFSSASTSKATSALKHARSQASKNHQKLQRLNASKQRIMKRKGLKNSYYLNEKSSNQSMVTKDEKNSKMKNGKNDKKRFNVSKRYELLSKKTQKQAKRPAQSEEIVSAQSLLNDKSSVISSEQTSCDILAKATQSIFSPSSSSMNNTNTSNANKTGKSMKRMLENGNANNNDDNSSRADNEQNANENESQEQALENRSLVDHNQKEVNGIAKQSENANGNNKICDKQLNDMQSQETTPTSMNVSATKGKEKCLSKSQSQVDKTQICANSETSDENVNNSVHNHNNSLNVDKSISIDSSFASANNCERDNNTLHFEFCHSQSEEVNTPNNTNASTIENENELGTLLLSSLTDENDASTESVHSVSNSSLQFLSLSPDHLSDFLPKENLQQQNSTDASNVASNRQQQSSSANVTTSFRINSNEQNNRHSNNQLHSHSHHKENNNFEHFEKSGDNSHDAIVEQRLFSNYLYPLNPPISISNKTNQNFEMPLHQHDNTSFSMASYETPDRDVNNQANSNSNNTNNVSRNVASLFSPTESTRNSNTQPQQRQQQNTMNTNQPSNAMPMRVHRNSSSEQQQLHLQQQQQSSSQSRPDQRQSQQQRSTSSTTSATVNKPSNNASSNYTSNSFSIYSAEALISRQTQPVDNPLDVNNDHNNRYNANSSRINQMPHHHQQQPSTNNNNINFLNNVSNPEIRSASRSFTAESLIQPNVIPISGKAASSQRRESENDNTINNSNDHRIPYYQHFPPNSNAHSIQPRNSESNNTFNYNRNSTSSSASTSNISLSSTPSFPQLTFQPQLPEIMPTNNSTSIFPTNSVSRNSNSISNNTSNANSSSTNISSTSQHSPVASFSSSSTTPSYQSQSLSTNSNLSNNNSNKSRAIISSSNAPTVSTLNPFSHTSHIDNYGNNISVYSNLETGMSASSSNHQFRNSRSNEISFGNCSQPTIGSSNSTSPAANINSTSNAGCFFTNSSSVHSNSPFIAAPNTATPFPPLPLPNPASPFDPSMSMSSHRAPTAPIFPTFHDFNHPFVSNTFVPTGNANNAKQTQSNQTRNSAASSRSPNSSKQTKSNTGNNKNSKKGANKQNTTTDNSNSMTKHTNDPFFSMSEYVNSSPIATQSTNRYTNNYFPTATSQNQSRHTEHSSSSSTLGSSNNTNGGKSTSNNTDSSALFRPQSQSQNSSININFQPTAPNFSVNSLQQSNRNSSSTSSLNNSNLSSTHHVPNFNLSNIFPDINTNNNSDNLSSSLTSPMKFPPSNSIIPHVSPPVPPTSASQTNQTASIDSTHHNQSQHQHIYHSSHTPNNRISSTPHNHIQFNSFLGSQHSNAPNFEPQISSNRNSSQMTNAMTPHTAFAPHHHHTHTYTNLPPFNFSMNHEH